MREPAIWIGFILAMLMAVMQSALFPHIAILAFAPLIGIVCMHAPYHKALWLAALGGFCSDLLSADPFGVYALSAALVCAAIHPYRKRFFKDQPLQLCFYTALISSIQTPLQLIILFLFDRRTPLVGKWLFLDFFTGPLIDAAYAFFWFVGPLLLLEWGKRQWMLWRLKYAS